jgi:hypothetical protein
LRRLRAPPERSTPYSPPANTRRSTCHTGQVEPECAQRQLSPPAGARALERANCGHDRPWRKLERCNDPRQSLPRSVS